MVEIKDFKNIVDLLKVFNTEQKCIEHLEKLQWNGNPVSPFDTESKVYKCAGNKYKCKNTGKYFNVRTGTIFEDTKVPLQKWFIALYIISSHKKGLSSHQLARDIGVTQKSAWFMLHRLRYAFDHPNFKRLMKGTIEIDETYIGGKDKNKHADKKTKGNQGRSVKEKTAVLGILKREGNVIAQKVSDTQKFTIQPIIACNVFLDSVVYTDEWKAYKGLGIFYRHNVINHQRGEYVKGDVHTNTIEGFWSLFKRGVVGIYHSISPEHLNSYLTEFAFRYNTRTISESSRFDMILANVANKRLRYKNLINHE